MNSASTDRLLRPELLTPRDADDHQRRKSFSYAFFAAKLTYTTMVLFIVLRAYQDEPTQARAVVVGLAVLGLVAGGACLWLLRNDHVTLANGLIFSLDIAIVLLWAHLSGGAHGAVLPFLFSLYAAQAFLLPRRFYLTIGGLGVLCYLLLAAIEQFSGQPLPPDSGPSTYIFNYVGSFLALLAVAGHFSASLSRAVHDLLHQTQALDAANQRLQEQQRTREAVGSQVAEAAGLLAERAADQSTWAQQTAQAVTDSSQRVDHLSAEATAIAHTADAVNHAADHTLSQVAAARLGLAAGAAGMAQTVEQVTTIAALARRLEERSQHIGRVIHSIEDVAQETHLLALNATIEAAGAGTYGRRFGVVAQQVQELARTSDAATVTVRGLLAELRADIEAVAAATQQGLAVAEQGAAQVEGIGGATANIERLSRQTAQLAQTISDTTAQQQRASAEAADQMRGLLALAAHEAAGAQQGAHAAATLREVARRLNPATPSAG